MAMSGRRRLQADNRGAGRNLRLHSTDLPFVAAPKRGDWGKLRGDEVSRQ